MITSRIYKRKEKLFQIHHLHMRIFGIVAVEFEFGELQVPTDLEVVQTDLNEITENPDDGEMESEDELDDENIPAIPFPELR